MKELFSQFVPDVFDRIEFGCIGRKFQQANVLRCFERIPSMPTRTVNHHDDALIGMALCDFIEE